MFASPIEATKKIVSNLCQLCDLSHESRSSKSCRHHKKSSDTKIIGENGLATNRVTLTNSFKFGRSIGPYQSLIESKVATCSTHLSIRSSVLWPRKLFPSQ